MSDEMGRGVAALAEELAGGVLVLDFGSAHTLAIARGIREMGVYCEVWPCNGPRVRAFLAAGVLPAKGLVLSGAAEPLDIDGQPDLEALRRLGAPALSVGALVGAQEEALAPEFLRSEAGRAALKAFVLTECGCAPDWTMTGFIEAEIARIRARVGVEQRVICGLSGGVDSSVVAAMLHRAVGARLTCVFVDHGLCRYREAERVRAIFEEHFGVDLRVVQAQQKFLGRLAGVEDPERKRRIIGETFIEVFEEVARDIPGAKFLAQGTLYPDVVESVSVRGAAGTIKSHHNVGGLPEELNFELIEPLRELFKDEVRVVGRALGLPADMVDRHPFPGPGLGVRVLGAITPEKVEMVRAADRIFIEALREEGLYHSVWQAFAVLLPVHSVGMSAGLRTYEQAVALRAVLSRDGMRADFAHLPLDFLGRVSERIIQQVDGINRVVYDVTSKPPGTIEWE